jgi:hypothetical protein
MSRTARHFLTPYAAYVLAAQLRARRVHASGKDVLRWPRNSVICARLWLKLDPGLITWYEYMGDDLPPPSQHSWPHLSASGRDLDGAGPRRSGPHE